jgi:hypothetical protein
MRHGICGTHGIPGNPRSLSTVSPALILKELGSKRHLLLDGVTAIRAAG